MFDFTNKNAMIWKYEFAERSMANLSKEPARNSEHGKVAKMDGRTDEHTHIHKKATYTDMKNYCVPRTIINRQEFVLEFSSVK